MLPRLRLLRARPGGGSGGGSGGYAGSARRDHHDPLVPPRQQQQQLGLVAGSLLHRRLLGVATSGAAAGGGGRGGAEPLPARARVVVCGAGIVGTSVAFHLAELGWTDVLLLEQGRLSGGTTRMCAGIVSSVRHLPLEIEAADYSLKLYQSLEKDTGISTGFKKTGVISLAQTQNRIISLQRIAAQLNARGTEAMMLTAQQVLEMHPWVRARGGDGGGTGDILGGLLVPGDGTVSPGDVCRALAHAAVAHGVQIRERTAVNHILVDKGRVTAVETDHGEVECEFFVNCAGQWAYELGQCSDEAVSVPLHPCEHFYLLTQPLSPPFGENLPVILDLDGRVYVREWQGGVLSGGYEKNPKPIFTEGKNQVEFQTMEQDWDHYEPLLGALLHRMPGLDGAAVSRLVNCPEAFTPDLRCIMGEAPNVHNYFVLAGMNSAGSTLAGGLGKYLAEWMVTGSPSENVWPLDVRRFGGLQSSRTFLRHRIMEVVPLTFERKFPHVEFQTGRRLRMSPLFDRLDAQGARWAEKHGYERPKFFVPPDWPHEVDERGTFFKPSWFDIVRAEVASCREGVSVIDMTSFTKFELRSAGNESLELLQSLCANDLDVPVGSIAHTGMLNEAGGYENDCSAVRVTKGNFLVISPTDQHVRSWRWLSQHLPADGSVQLEDVSDKYTALNLIGPRAQDVLSELSYTPVTPEHFPSMLCKEMSIGYANGIRIMSMTHTGEPGFMLYIPTEYALHVYNELMNVGKKFGIRNAGYLALRSLRIEKLFAFWGQDLDPHTTPLECGREFRVKFDKGVEFVGQEALLRQREAGVRRRLTMLLLDDHDPEVDPWPWGGEPIICNGDFAGLTTSCDYSFGLERHVCLGFVCLGQPITPDLIARSEYEVQVAQRRYQARAKLYPVPIMPRS
ncbi:pyruvate dehydrogenase phosphatase regulatory subunit, mitochondrial isoform X2 [Lampetra fluviatilis]